MDGIYVIDLRVTSLHVKLQVIPSIFDYQIAQLSLQCTDVLNFNRNFWRF